MLDEDCACAALVCAAFVCAKPIGESADTHVPRTMAVTILVAHKDASNDLDMKLSRTHFSRGRHIYDMNHLHHCHSIATLLS
jgi:hypothetical protein